MSFSVFGTNITLTRGDTFKAYVDIYNSDGTEYVPSEGDVVRFALKRSYSDCSEVLIVKEIPIDTLLLQLDPSDTKDLSYKTYVYDIQITFANGDVDTFLRGELTLTEEVE